MLGLLRAIRNKMMLFFVVRQNVTYGKKFHVGPGSVIEASKQLTIGDFVYIGKHCTVEVNGKIGNNVLIANNVGLIGRYDHDFRTVGQPMNRRQKNKVLHNERIVIGDDVWIGYGAIVLSGVEIGRGSVIGAGSVVAHDVFPYSIVCGNPARVIGVRFSPAEIAKHEQLLYGRILTK